MMGYLNDEQTREVKRVTFNTKASLQYTLTKLARFQDVIEYSEVARANPRAELREAIAELKKQLDILDKTQSI
jgi:polyhydroxyalkanoate synthesis regulator phasin